jgi:hypothetical protein
MTEPPCELELFPGRYFQSVSVGIFLVFYQPIPKENWVGTFRYPKKGGSGPLFVHFAPLLRKKKGIPAEFFKKRVPAKSSKGVPLKLTVQKY